MKSHSLTSKVLLCSLQNGESWHPDNCTKETCTNGTLIIEHVNCEPANKPDCVNDRQPVRVYDETGCCYHYECPCKFK